MGSRPPPTYGFPFFLMASEIYSYYFNPNSIHTQPLSYLFTLHTSQIYSHSFTLKYIPTTHIHYIPYILYPLCIDTQLLSIILHLHTSTLYSYHPNANCPAFTQTHSKYNKVLFLSRNGFGLDMDATMWHSGGGRLIPSVVLWQVGIEGRS